MNFAQDQKAGSRLTGFGIVILIHVLIVWALASGLATKVVEAVKGPIDVKVVEEKVKPPPPPEKVVPPPPDLKAPPPPFVPPPEVTVTAPPPPMAAVAVQSTTPPPTNTVAPTNPTPAPVAAPAPRPAKITAAMVCTKMGKPDIPAVNWAGRAEYKATATVKAGRVTSVELAVIRGANDRKAERALRAAVVSALTDTYECPGDHVFEQEFVFNID
ncbi:ABC transporter substrate-binding protein [Pelomonas sp. CA6]|uniref:ABC transporter substrate-binding protein n=1 Tax=Pelomonas sp. CA6 TaxID=2907999 RepID=UPI001F4BE8C0|nr:ABC transporter substrate-binding protein [Pelomonas sp. CA6]MCH7345754.1 ABC transporter substrate-binding protein [Pelomonas sp. CA6]